MNSRERMLTALSNGRPDRLPCQVHGWMGYYLKNALGGIDQWEAFERFGMDFAIYVSPTYVYDDRSLANWAVETVNFPESTSAVTVYPIAILKHASQPALAQKFVDLITGPTGEKVLSQAGFANP